MAPKTQGLQVLLIVFVMLTVVLGVTTYLYNKRADEAAKAALAADGRVTEAKKATGRHAAGARRPEDVHRFPRHEGTEEIKKQFTEDMQNYGNEKKSDAEPGKAGGDAPLFDTSTLFYSRLLAGMNKVIQDRTDELIKSRALVADLQTRFKNREAMKDDAIAALTAGYGKLDAEVKKTSEAFISGTTSTADEVKRLNSQVVAIKSTAARSVTEAADAANLAKKAVMQKSAELATVLAQREKRHRPQMDVPSGEITWVSLPNKTVWINRGRADDLQRQTRFTVYSADSTNAATAVKKGSVEVVKIEGDHMSQARIIDDKLADPIMAGDKVFTPLWSPGQQNHFALTGIMNLDGDGRNQLSVVRGLINQSGGAVDCELDEQGHKQGQITADTRFIVVGDAPDKSSAEFVKNHGEILHESERYHLQVLKLNDFKQQMGYQKTSSVEHFGSRVAHGTTSVEPPAPRRPKPAAKAAPASDDTFK